mgnify:FL=1
MSNCKKAKEEIKVKLDKGIFKTCPKPNTATAHWWKTFVRIKDDQDIVLPFVQCVKSMMKVNVIYMFGTK